MFPRYKILLYCLDDQDFVSMNQDYELYEDDIDKNKTVSIVEIFFLKLSQCNNSLETSLNKQRIHNYLRRMRSKSGIVFISSRT